MPRRPHKLATVLLALASFAGGAHRPVMAGAAGEWRHAVNGQAGGGVQAAGPKFRLVRAMSGTKGSERGGQYIIEDPRSTFYVPDDRQIIVYLEWEGPQGPHHLEGFWKTPEGKVASLSDFNYDAKQTRFGAYWTIPLPEKVGPGMWSFEARIDGELAASYTFQIVLSPRPAGAISTRRLLTPSEIYQRALSATVTVEKVGESGQVLSTASGFVVASHAVLTSFQAIDGAHAVRLIFEDGQERDTDRVAAWDRREDWAVVIFDGASPAALPSAPANSVLVGDRCFTLNVSSNKGRVLIDGNVIGVRDWPEVGKRWSVSFEVSPRADGMPLLDEYGEAAGIVVRGSLLPGSVSLDALHFRPTNLLQAGGTVNEILVEPMDSIHLPSEQAGAVTLASLKEGGSFTPPLAGDENVETADIGTSVEKKGVYPVVNGEKFEFSRHDGDVAAFVVWAPKGKIRSDVSFGIYGLDNREVIRTKPAPMKSGPGQRKFTSWRVDISTLPPATYRLDVLLGGVPAWRTYFRVVP